MPFTAEDRQEIGKIVAEALEVDFNRRRALRMQEKEKAESRKETHLYLISLTGHQIAFPDENGRAVFSQCVYARALLDPESPAMWSAVIDVIAFGDGRLLKEPVKLILTGGGVVGMVQVDESILRP